MPPMRPRFTYLVSTLLLSIAAIAGGGCGDDTQDGAVPADAAAVVNGVAIPKGPIERQIKAIYRNATQSGSRPTPAQLAEVRRHFTNGRIEDEVQRQEAKALGLRVKGDEPGDAVLRRLASRRTGPPQPPRGKSNERTTSGTKRSTTSPRPDPCAQYSQEVGTKG